ncbi:MAG: hypothetical protein AB7G75_11580 [Candidatus Binatia bacterium]
MMFLVYFTGLLFISLVGLAVAAPLFSVRAGQEMLPEQLPEIAHWEKQKSAAYAAIKEAEFDRQMGKLTDEDYLTLRKKYETQALEALAHIDRLNGDQNLRDQQKTESLTEA